MNARGVDSAEGDAALADLVAVEDEGVTNTQVINIPVGSLVVDMYDGPKHQLVFRTMASDTLSGNEDKNSKKLARSVKK